MKKTQTHSKESQSRGNREVSWNKTKTDTFFPKNEIHRSFFPKVQPRLTIGQPTDKHEADADAVADKTVNRLGQPESNAPAPFFHSINRTAPVQPKYEESSDEELYEEEDALEEEVIQRRLKISLLRSADRNIQAKTEGEFQGKRNETGVSSSLEQQLGRSKGKGSSMSESLQNSMETAFGADFSNVKIHTGNSAVQMSQGLNAHAFTHGSNIFFNEGKYDPGTSAGQHLLAHELTHVVQQGEAANRVQRFVPDHEEVSGGIQLPKAYDLNQYFWDALNLEELKPLREYNPIDTPNAYANQTREAQKIIKKSRNIPGLYGKQIWTDGILGSETLVFLRFVSVTEELAAERFEIAGLGFDLEALASTEGLIQTSKAMVALFLPTFLVEWELQAPGEPVIDFIVRDQEMEITESWYDAIIFGGPPPSNVPQDFDLGDRHAILKKAYKDQTLNGIAGLVEVQRGFLNKREDSKILVKRDKGTIENNLWITYSAETESRATLLESRFGITYPSQKALDIRKVIGKKKTGKFKEKLTGLLLSFYIPELTDMERVRLSMVADEYFQEKSESIKGFIQPRAEELIELIEAEGERSYIQALKIKQSLGAFIGRPELFEKMAEFLENHERKNYFRLLIRRTEQLKSISALERLIKLCMQTRFKDYEIVTEALATLEELKKSVSPHEYITGDRHQQGVKLGSGQLLKVGDVTSGMYRITETRQQIKEARRKELEDKMRELAESHMDDSLNAEGGSGQNMTDEQFMEMILEKAQQEVKITEEDMQEVKYEEAFRLKEVASQTIDGIEEFRVAYEKVFRTGGEGEWKVLEPGGGLRNQAEFEERLAWFKFANLMRAVETAVTVGAIVVGGVVLLTSGAAAGLIALGGGAKMVALSIGISVLIWAITADNHTLEGFLKAVLEGYLMAVGLRLFAPAGAAAARWVGTATFKQKLMGLLLQSVITGGASGAFTGAGTLFAEDLIRGKLRSPGEYLKAAATGFLLGAVFELGGSLILGPIFRTAGRNTLERIKNIGSLKQFLKDAGINLKNIRWGPEVSKSFATFNKWLNTNLDKELAQQVAAKAKEKAIALLRSFGEGFELTVHRQALDLIESGMSKEAVGGLEKLIGVTSRNLDTVAARETVDEILNQLVNNPARANAYMALIEAADDALLQKLVGGNGLKDLAGSGNVLSLAGTRSPIQVAHLLELRFDGKVLDFESWAQGLNAQTKDAQSKVLDILNTRGASVTHESVLRIAQSGASMADTQIGGLARMVNNSRSSSISLGVFDDFIRHVPDDKMEIFLQKMNHYPAGDFADMMKIVDDPARANRLLSYVEDPDQLLRMLQASGKKLDDLDNLFQATRGRPRAPKEIESLMTEYGGDANTLRQAIAQVDGDASLLNKSIQRLGSKADVEQILNKTKAHPVTTSDPKTMNRFLKMADDNAWNDANKLELFIEKIHNNQAQQFKHTFKDAVDRLDDFAKHHSGSTSPPPIPSGHGPLNLASPNSFMDFTLTNGSTARVHAKAENLQHYLEGHTFENFWFDPAKINRAGVSTFWPPKTTNTKIIQDFVEVIDTNDFKNILENAVATGQTFGRTPPFINIGGTEFQIGVTNPNFRADLFHPMSGKRAFNVSKHILFGVKELLGL